MDYADCADYPPRRRPSACPSHPRFRAPNRPCVPYLALPCRVRFAFHLCSYAKRTFSPLPSSLFPKGVGRGGLTTVPLRSPPARFEHGVRQKKKKHYGADKKHHVVRIHHAADHVAGVF